MGEVKDTLIHVYVGWGEGVVERKGSTMLESPQASPDLPFGRCSVKMKTLEYLESVAEIRATEF
jgi:hypothetical protein